MASDQTSDFIYQMIRLVMFVDYNLGYYYIFYYLSNLLLKLVSNSSKRQFIQ